ncbi:3-keto-disaccharide hydrolase [Confluentibacter flavum]|uniref:DUF1080 domain-containing protein n=1 Tax=Confluentibacter flavum TaxID=1909700 RepID=A0A2N3HP31_9FLAO|nr:DUF1080 domain-containing protein [Confluentibacter flavum]PKQ46682.1 DUF1080 domain-containing protein [Confluentibacter flavum]
MNVTNFIKKARLHLLILAILVLNSSCKNSQTLFQENASNWDKNGDATWEFSDGILNGSIMRGNSFVMTNQKYDDYILEMEFSPDAAINSGVYIHCSERVINTEKCYEVNISDTNPTPANRTGSIVPIAPQLVAVETINKWNTLKIKVEGNHFQAWTNGTLTADATDDKLSDGFIALQALGNNQTDGKIQFRNIKITPLK